MSTERDPPDHRKPDSSVSADLLREQAEQVSPAVAERLAAARRAAVADMAARQHAASTRRLPLWLAGCGAAAAALALTVALLLPGEEPGPEALLLADADELEAVARLEVLEELEFLAWLDEEQLDAGQG